MKKILLLLLLAGISVGCNDAPGPPDPPEPPPIDEPTDPPVDPPVDPPPVDPPVDPPPVDPPIDPPVDPPVDPPPSNVDLYIPMRQVEGIINGTGVPIEQNAINHGMVWGAGRAFRDAANNCPWSCNDPNDLYFGKTCAEMHDIHLRSIDLNAEGLRMIDKLRKENRRCDPNHRLYDPNFIDLQGRCRRSEVRVFVYEEFRTRHDAHLNEAADLTAIGGACQSLLRSHGGSAFDTVGGWCQSANDARGRDWL